MVSKKKERELAQKLYLEGESTDLIAQRCSTSRRTIQRWVKDFEKEPATITVKAETATKEPFQENNSAKTSSNDVETSLDDAKILPTLEKVAELQSGDELDMTLSSKMALHLLKLTEKSLCALDDCLTNPDVRSADKIKAAQLIGEWTGLKDGQVLQRVTRAFDISDLRQTLDVDTSKVTLVPRAIADVRKQNQQKLEQARKTEENEHQDLVEDYNWRIYQQYCKSRQLPLELDEDLFCVFTFLQFSEPNESLDYQFTEKIRENLINELWKRGIQEELIDAGYLYELQELGYGEQLKMLGY